ncbi:MAG TPA: hypothetical protein VK882_07115 [Nitrososphaeraceae archaeon]|nr:hypothetical protein [Nitrososphaeraceae archaeon]
MQIEKTSSYVEWCYDSSTKKLKTTQPSSHCHPKNYYTLRYFFNTNETFFHLFMHTKVYDKITNENIEKHGILLRSWNPITKRGQRYVFRKGEEGDGDLNLQRIHLPNTKTIFEFSTVDNINEESYCKLAEEIIKECPHKDIELITNNLM